MGILPIYYHPLPPPYKGGRGRNKDARIPCWRIPPECLTLIISSPWLLYDPVGWVNLRFMVPKVLLVNPPVYDFSAHDFWLKPYGLLTVAGYLRGQADLCLFDYMDRLHPLATPTPSDDWGRGKYLGEIFPKPEPFHHVPRYFRRYGLERAHFQKYLQENGPFDFALVQTVMTYWYLGVQEVIEDIRAFTPQTRIVLGGVYATLCPNHASSLGVDFVVRGDDLSPFWQFMSLNPDYTALPFWEGYTRLEVGVLKLADGCPFRCTYCSVPQTHPRFESRSLGRSLAELQYLAGLGVKNIAFYDDALLFKTDLILLPFLREAAARSIEVNYHTPNALNARFIKPDLAEILVSAGFKTFYLGFESSSYEWQRNTGGKVYADEFAEAAQNLFNAGAEPGSLTAYTIIGHPNDNHQAVEKSMSFASRQGVRLMLSEFSPVPGTLDGESAWRWVAMDEPLNHNKIAFSLRTLGPERMDALKQLCRKLNKTLKASASHAMIAAGT